MNATLQASWSVRPDLLVRYQPELDPPRWLISLRGSGRSYRLNETHFRLLCSIATGVSDNSSINLDSERAQGLVAKLAELDMLIPGSKNAPRSIEPESWFDPLEVARWALTAYTQGNWPIIQAPAQGMLMMPGSCYVCLKRDGLLRGCFGSIKPCRVRLVDDILQNTMAAACWDYRFTPTTAAETVDIELTVDVIETVEVVSSLSDWDPAIFGLQLRRGPEVVATLLPGLAGISSSVQQLRLSLRKAALASADNLEIARFTTRRFPDVNSLPVNPYQPALMLDHWELTDTA